MASRVSRTGRTGKEEQKTKTRDIIQEMIHTLVVREKKEISSKGKEDMT